MGKIIWLASYPRSGNTWMRVLLTNYLCPADQPADIDSIGIGYPIASSRQSFDEHVGIESSDLTDAEVQRYRPRVYEQISERSEETVFLKVHEAFTYNDDGSPLISKAATKAVLYLIRNPLDVAVSFASHSRCPIQVTVDAMGEEGKQLGDAVGRAQFRFPEKILTWSRHVTSWVDEPGLNVHVVRFEDLIADTAGTFAEVVRFSELEEDPHRIAKAVEFSSFKKLQAQERDRGFGERLPQSESFFRRGKVGSWSEQMPADLIKKLIADQREVMFRFGYLTDNGAPID